MPKAKPLAPVDEGLARARRQSPSIALARSLATVLDTWRVDPLVGTFLPFFGDVACGLVGLGIVGIAAWHRVPKVTMARMLLNIAFDAMLGAIPIVGDILDFWFPAHLMNVRLLERAEQQRRSHPSDYFILALALCACLVALALPIWVGIRLVQVLLTSH